MPDRAICYDGVSYLYGLSLPYYPGIKCNYHRSYSLLYQRVVGPPPPICITGRAQDFLYFLVQQQEGAEPTAAAVLLTFLPPFTVPPATGRASSAFFFPKSKNIDARAVLRSARSADDDDLAAETRWVRPLGRVALRPKPRMQVFCGTGAQSLAAGYFSWVSRNTST